MQIDIHDDKKMVCIWLTRAEADDDELQEKLRPFIKKYHEKKYIVAVYKSGPFDLFECTLELLKRNRWKMALIEERKEARKEK